MDEATITQLLNQVNGGTSTGTSSLFDVGTIMKSLAPYVIALTAVSIVITVLYLFSVINKWRADKAIVDIKKILIEMNERDKSRMPQDAAMPTPEGNEQPRAVEASLPVA